MVTGVAAVVTGVAVATESQNAEPWATVLRLLPLPYPNYRQEGAP
ncbi:hypothetical protein BJ970_004469 [Saccharopolyspora phatthalungensis]|uniref:Uncharacterized protein n=1 Tax=Saccharopolyspora phatthalungensis TaxID=664693 RepID=A0A840QEM1_9PSEU|nr:hypothetical protein [Saccharopolyspora phatthalungensis]